jgi:hypothetical protein
MSDVFISYAREDHEFVRWLGDALTSASKTSWVDWRSIPPSADRLQEVFEGIDRSDVFVFVLSAHALRSDVCLSELAHAAAHDKRVIPLAMRHPAGDRGGRHPDGAGPGGPPAELDPVSGRRTTARPLGAPLKGHTNSVTGVALSPDDRTRRHLTRSARARGRQDGDCD